MSQADFETRLADLAARDPLALTRDPAAGSDAALRAAEAMAPAGVRTEGAFLRTVVAAGPPVGWIWFTLPSARRPAVGQVLHLEIAAADRRRGHGRAALAAAEAELARHPVPRFGLGVPGEPVAQAFADALDLPVASQQRWKVLTA
jgi:ribosomal protein S18 acetylase RimI-like enzyme